MTDELQAETADLGITLDNDHVESEETGQATEETAESGAELAPATEDKQDKSNDGVQKAINKQHAKYKEEERKRIASESEAKELREKLEAIEAKQGVITIPEMPDAYDEDFTAKMAERDDAIKRQATQDAQKESITERQDAQKVEAGKVEQERVDGLVAGYDKRIVTLGLNVEEIKQAGEKIVSYGIAGDVAQYILGDEDGPLIAKYLADNPIVLDDLSNMQPIAAAMKINSDIRSAASANRPQASQTPDPDERLDGRGPGEQVHQSIKGATFE